MENLGFEKISFETWVQPDKLNEVFVRYSENFDEKHIITDHERLEQILEPQLTDFVPIEVHKLFEVARGAIAYGYYFYPLYTLGTEQLFRVAETAVAIKCKELKAPNFINNFYKGIDYLVKEGEISEENQENWHLNRELRNSTSHPKDQMIILPNNSIMFLNHIANIINSLFLKKEG